jgi:fatty acid synthase subunit alpha
MAKRTIKSKYEAQDETLSRRRQLLSGDSDLAEIYYEVDPQPATTEQSSGSGNGTIDSPPPYTSEPSSAEAAKTSPEPVRTKAVRSSKKKPDARITAQEILVGIVAQKLKKASNDIAVTSTIKSLASGMCFLLPPINIMILMIIRNQAAQHWRMR